MKWEVYKRLDKSVLFLILEISSVPHSIWMVLKLEVLISYDFLFHDLVHEFLSDVMEITAVK